MHTDHMHARKLVYLQLFSEGTGALFEIFISFKLSV